MSAQTRVVSCALIVAAFTGGLFRCDPRESFASIVKDCQVGAVLSFAKLAFGPSPKHLDQQKPCLVTAQVRRLIDTVLERKGGSIFSAEKCRVLCGPLGVGKSSMLWLTAVAAYAAGRCVLYVADAFDWMDQHPALRVRYLINCLLSFSRDKLTSDQLALLQHPSAQFHHLKDVLQVSNAVVLIDEHAAIVSVYEDLKRTGELYSRQPWIDSFIHLQGFFSSARNVTMVLAASSHGRFELLYMKNGSQPWKFFVLPPTEQEACELFRLQGGLAQQLAIGASAPRSLIFSALNRVPRELTLFAEFLARTAAEAKSSAGAGSAAAPASESKSSAGAGSGATQALTADRARSLLDSFIAERAESQHAEADKYFGLLTPDQKGYFINSLSALFRKASFSDGVGDTSGFIDLGLCYRQFDADYKLVLLPLCLSASRALLRLLHREQPKQAEYLEKMQELHAGTIRGDDFEDLTWLLFTRAALSPGGLELPAYFLDGSSGGNVRLHMQDYVVLERGAFPPEALRGRPILYRFAAGNPRWDFGSGQMMVQVSVSTFGTHNKDSADISLSFDDQRSDISGFLNSVLDEKHTASLTDDGKFVVRSGNQPKSDFQLVYLTRSKPNHPVLMQRFKDLRVIAAEECWKLWVTLAPEVARLTLCLMMSVRPGAMPVVAESKKPSKKRKASECAFCFDPCCLLLM
jgi:hypothetical protein